MSPDGAGRPLQRLLFILGTRPEAIKLAPVILQARGHRAMQARVLSTGQHREMLDPILRFFGIAPDLDLGVMSPGQSLADLTARAVAGIGTILAGERPDAVVVQGDTTTAMAGALAAFYAGVPVAHVEAGLRTGRLDAPFPEEFNRRAIALVADWHFAPTRRAAEAIRAENLPSRGANGSRIVVTGNTVIDALATAVARAHESTHPLAARVDQWRAEGPDRRFILVTGHRRESFGAPLRDVCAAIADIAARHPGALIVYPVHRNPNVADPVASLLGNVPRVELCAPMEYPDFTALMARADLIITDSGGIQEEAPALGIPVVVTRETTERPEALSPGRVELAGHDRGAIAACAQRLLAPRREGLADRILPNPFGDGRASWRVVSSISGVDAQEAWQAESAGPEGSPI